MIKEMIKFKTIVLQSCFCCSGCGVQLERKFFTEEDLPVCEDCYKVSLHHDGGHDGGECDEDEQKQKQ